MSDTSIGPPTVRHIAALARIDLDDDELATFSTQFEEILDYFETLDDVPEVKRERERVNVMRNDEVCDSLDHEAALANAPAVEDGYFKGPRVS